MSYSLYLGTSAIIFLVPSWRMFNFCWW